MFMEWYNLKLTKPSSVV